MSATPETLGEACGIAGAPRPYRMKPQRVVAAFWDGSRRRAQELAKIFPAKLRVLVIEKKHPLSRQAEVVILDLPGPREKSMQLNVPGWVVKGQGGGMYFCTPAEFEAIYEEPSAAEMLLVHLAGLRRRIRKAAATIHDWWVRRKFRQMRGGDGETESNNREGTAT